MTCAKKVMRCLIIKNTRIFEGTNDCLNPQPSCPRAPHRRERLWFVANMHGNSSDERQCGNGIEERGEVRVQGAAGTSSSTMGDTSGQGLQGYGRPEQEFCSEGWEAQERHSWETGVWIDCPDGKQRLVEPRIPLLVDGYPERVGIIHCAGDAIVPQVAAEFIKAFVES